jgi:hypothetical protein
MRLPVVAIVVAMLLMALGPGSALAQWSMGYWSGHVPCQLGSEPDVGDLDGDGQYEIVVKLGHDPLSFRIYDLYTGVNEYSNTVDSEIEMIHIVPRRVSGGELALIQCIDGDTYVVSHPGVASVSPDAQAEIRQSGLMNSPNPFSRSTRIDFNLPREGRVEVKVFDVNGRLVRSIEESRVQAGKRSLEWDGCDSDGRAVAPGAYFYSLYVDGEAVQTNKAITIR